MSDFIPAGFADLLERPQPIRTASAETQSAPIPGIPADFADLLQKPADPLPSKTGQTVEPLSGWNEAYKGFADRTQIGFGSLNKSLAGWKLAVGDEAFEEAQKEVETQALLQAQIKKTTSTLITTGGLLG